MATYTVKYDAQFEVYANDVEEAWDVADEKLMALDAALLGDGEMASTIITIEENK